MSCKTLQGKYAEKLEQKIDDAVDYINKITLVILKDYEKYKDTPLKNTMIGKDLLKILGGKNER